jgi:hypothetical protein
MRATGRASESLLRMDCRYSLSVLVVGATMVHQSVGWCIGGSVSGEMGPLEDEAVCLTRVG